MGSSPNIDRNPGTAQSRQAAARAAQSVAAPQFNAAPVYTGPTYEQMLADREALTERNRITQGLNDRDSAYMDYLSAADSATNFINTQIEQERANAALTGVDYVLDDESKTTRINDYFASIYNSAEQQQLEALFSEFGTPEGFDGFTVVRGTAAEEQERGTGETESTTGRRPAGTVLTPDETLGNDTVLGGA